MFFFKYDNTNFQKQRKQSANYQHQGIAHLKIFQIYIKRFAYFLKLLKLCCLKHLFEMMVF